MTVVFQSSRMISLARLLPVRTLRLSSSRLLSSSLCQAPPSLLSTRLTVPPSQQPVVRGPLVFQSPPATASLLNIARHFSSGGGDGKDSVESAAYDVSHGNNKMTDIFENIFDLCVALGEERLMTFLLYRQRRMRMFWREAEIPRFPPPRQCRTTGPTCP